MDELTTEQCRELKVALSQLRLDLKVAMSQSADAAKPVTLDQQSIGRVSRVDAIQQQKMAEANRRRQRLRLSHVKQALEALDRDEYGECRRCQEPIGYARLKARPETAICMACQTALEGRR